MAKTIQFCFPRTEAKMMKTAFELSDSVVSEQIKRHLKVAEREIDFLLNLFREKKAVITFVIMKSNLIPLI